MNLVKLNRLLSQKEGQLKKMEALIIDNEKEQQWLEKELFDITQAEELLKVITKSKQEQNIKYIEVICTNALNTIFDDNITFKVELTKSGGAKLGYNFFIYDEDSETKTDPRVNEAGGLQDIIGFVLRVALWAVQRQKVKFNTLILDEPFSAFSVEDMQRVGTLIRELSERLEIQFIIATHKENIFINNFGKLEIIKKRKD